MEIGEFYFSKLFLHLLSPKRLKAELFRNSEQQCASSETFNCISVDEPKTGLSMKFYETHLERATRSALASTICKRIKPNASKMHRALTISSGAIRIRADHENRAIPARQVSFGSSLWQGKYGANLAV